MRLLGDFSMLFLGRKFLHRVVGFSEYGFETRSDLCKCSNWWRGVLVRFSIRSILVQFSHTKPSTLVVRWWLGLGRTIEVDSRSQTRQLNLYLVIFRFLGRGKFVSAGSQLHGSFGRI